MKFRKAQWRGGAVSVPWGELPIFSEYNGRGGCAWEAAAVLALSPGQKTLWGKKTGWG